MSDQAKLKRYAQILIDEQQALSDEFNINCFDPNDKQLIVETLEEMPQDVLDGVMDDERARASLAGCLMTILMDDYEVQVVELVDADEELAGVQVTAKHSKHKKQTTH